MNETIRFSDFEIDTAALELRRQGEPVGLTPQAVRALIVLVRNAGRLVTRDELYAELWPEPEVDVDRGLNTLVRQIRIALGDDAGAPTFIRTYPRRGYRFLVAAGERELSARGPGSEGPAGDRRLLRAAAAGLVVVAVLVAAVLLGPLARAGGPPAAERIEGDAVEASVAAGGLDPAIRERFLEGRFLLEQGSPARRAEAVAPLSEVVAAAPSFAAGHAWLSDALFWAGRLEEARAAAQTALDLDDTEPRALVVRGTVRLVRDWDPAGAESDLREAVRLAGGTPQPHHALAFALATAGRHAEAIRELETAHRLDPVSAVVTGDLGLIHLYAGDLERAAEYCGRAQALEPEAHWAIECAFDALAHLGRHRQARPLAERMVAEAGESADGVLGGPDVPDAAATDRFRAWRADRAARALALGGSAWGAALAFADAGRAADALRALDLAARDRGPGLITITIDPRFRSLLDEPEFRELAAELAAHGFAALPS